MNREHETWRKLPFHSGPSSYHFALSDALVRLARVPTLWWHSTEEPTLILGTSQSRADLDLAACAQNGVRLVKRHSGGTAVFAGPGVLGLDVALPPGHPLIASDVVQSYRWIGEAWVATTHSLGIRSRLITLEEARLSARRISQHEQAINLACFGSLSPYEVAVEQRKLVGLAQVRRRTGVLLQSAVHLHFDAAGLVRLLAVDDPDTMAQELAGSAAGIQDFVASCTAADVIAAFEQALRALFPADIQPGSWTQEELRHAAAMEASTYV